MFDLIPVIFILLSLSGIIIILVRKFPSLVNIDLEQISLEKQSRVKDSLIENRFWRKLDILYEKIKRPFEPFRKLVLKGFEFFRNRILIWEEKTLKKRKDFLFKESAEEFRKKIEILMAEAEELEREERLEEAEKKYIEIISLDKENIPAYKALGEIYFQEKNYEHAREIFEHILKIISSDRKVLPEKVAEAVEAYLNLGMVYKIQGSEDKAFLNFQEAFRLEPNDPKVLDSLIEMSIILKNKKLAQSFLDKLKKVNPENEKIEEFEKRVRQIENSKI